MSKSRRTLKFLHPTDSTTTYEAAVSPESTPRFLIGKLQEVGWLPAAVHGSAYRLRIADSGVQLDDDVPIDGVDLGSGTLMVDHSLSGAHDPGGAQ